MTSLAYPVTQPVEFWTYSNDARETWPQWVQRRTITIDGELVHEHWSGRQVLYRGETLVRELDGAQNFYTPSEFEGAFEVRPA
jgi:hypothetical protein